MRYARFYASISMTHVRVMSAILYEIEVHDSHDESPALCGNSIALLTSTVSSFVILTRKLPLISGQYISLGKTVNVMME